MHNTPKQHTLWLLAALAAPAAHFSGSGWLTTAITVLTILPLTLLPKAWEQTAKPIALLQILWLGVAAGSLMPGSAAYWPSDNDLVVPLTLLTLAAFTKPGAAPRVGAVLAFCMGLLAIPTAISGATHIEAKLLKPAITSWPLGLTLTLLLPNLPAAGEQQKGRRLLASAALTIALSLLVQGVTATPVAVTLPDPFYQTARTMGHLEPIIAAGLTLGWYALSTWFFQSAAQLAENSGFSTKTAHVLLWGTATTLVMVQQQPDALFLSLLSLFLWVITPFFQKLKKVKNSA